MTKETEATVLQNCSAKLLVVDGFGRLKIKFNSTINTNFNLTTFNSKVADIYIRPYWEPGNDDQREERLAQNLNLTWEVQKVSDTELDI